MTAVATLESWSALAEPADSMHVRARAKVARRLFRAAVGRLDVTVDVCDSGGAVRLGQGGPLATIVRPEEFFARLGRDGLIGFGEAYMTGAWESDDLVGFLTALAAELPALIPPRLQHFRVLAVRRVPRQNRNTRQGSRSNIAHHYDLSNELFGLFLDPTMTYSCALFEGPMAGDGRHSRMGPPQGLEAADALPRAQWRKIDRLLDEAGVGSGTRLLEIGTGWGELAIRAAERGATVTTITLSAAQKELAETRIESAGVSSLISVELCDYRDVRGLYDAVVSVEMIEAVGWQFWATYLKKIDEVLVPGGRAAVQAITMPHDRMLASRGTHTWITKYIFPGGALPSVHVLESLARRRTSLRLVRRLDLGLHYAATLHMWDQAFRANGDAVTRLGFDDTFKRMWHFYFAYCEAGFAARYIDDNQLTFVKGMA